MNKFDQTELAKQVIDKMTPQEKEILRNAKRFRKPLTKIIQIANNTISYDLEVTRFGCGIIETSFGGKFWMLKFNITDDWNDYNVLIKTVKFDEYNAMPIFQKNEMMMRIDSGCGTGQVFHDMTCECHEQLQKSMEEIDKNLEGIIVHIPNQDGRGKGSAFKLSTLYLQQKLKLNTIEAAAVLCNPIDIRKYDGVVAILKYLNINEKTPINLATNNPDKIKALESNGFSIIHTPIIIAPTEATEKHLLAKEQFLNHQLSPEDKQK